VYSRRLTQKIAVEDDNENRGILKYFSIFIGSLSFLGLFSILLIQFFFSYSQYEPTVFKNNNPILIFLSFILFIILQFLIYRILKFTKISIEYFRLGLLVFTLVVGIGISIMFYSAPIFDVRSVMNGLISDSNSAITYVEYYPNNLGIVLLYQGIFKLFGRQSWILMYVINVASVVGIFQLLPRLAKLVTKDENVERICIQLLFFATPFIFTVSYLYNDLIGLFFTLLSLVLLLRFTTRNERKILNIILCGFSLAIAYILRTNTLIFVIGIILYLILRLIKDKKFSINHQLSFLPILILFIIQLIFNLSISSFIPNYTKEYSQPSNAWIAMSLADKKDLEGLNYQKPGMFNGFEDWAYGQYKKDNIKDSKKYIHDVEGRKDIYNKYIQKRLKYFASHPLQAIKFYSAKEVASWGDASFNGNNLLKSSYENQAKIYSTLPFSSISTQNVITKSNLSYYETEKDRMQSPIARYIISTNAILNYIQRPFLILVVLSTMFLLIKSRFQLNLEAFLLLLTFFGGFVFHEFIWETQPRYFLPYLALLVPLAAAGLNKIIYRKKQLK
jgi:hypothetical protein